MSGEKRMNQTLCKYLMFEQHCVCRTVCATMYNYPEEDSSHVVTIWMTIWFINQILNICLFSEPLTEVSEQHDYVEEHGMFSGFDKST